MRQKIKKSKLEACKLVWKKRITAEKGISDKCAERIVQECIKLIERMIYGNVMNIGRIRKILSSGFQNYSNTGVCYLLE